ncbi:hypothetical protein B5P41_18535 [Bacillus sp. SRB_28]|nr:hypothetical protein B5P41_18535 [Bacillus sp. SRB_28]
MFIPRGLLVEPIGRLRAVDLPLTFLFHSTFEVGSYCPLMRDKIVISLAVFIFTGFSLVWNTFIINFMEKFNGKRSK